jgi:hypothetical protein
MHAKRKASDPTKRQTPKITKAAITKYADSQYVKLLACLFARLTKAEPALYKHYLLTGETEDAAVWLHSAHQSRMVANALRQVEKGVSAEMEE